MIDALKLSLLRRNPSVGLRRLEEGPYLITFTNKAWLLWTSSSRWVEVNPEDHEERLGEMHYGPVGIFYEKYIRQKRFLPKNHGKLWVEEDIELLYELIDGDEPITQIAEKMGRSVSSVIAKTGTLLGYDFSYLNTSRGIDDLTFSVLIGDVQTLRDDGDDHN
jgi:hypothetical protein